MIKLSLQYYPDDLQQADNRDFKRMRLRELSSGIGVLRRQVEAVEEKIRHKESVQPTEFTDSKWLSADEKRKILKQWTGFVKNGFPETSFTTAIYEHLHLHCGYIAHYNKHGFYGEYWGAYARDLHRHAKEDNITLRSIPTAFYNWESFIRQFNIWGDYIDISTSLMTVLKTELEGLEKDLIMEARGHFDSDAINSYQLYLQEKQTILQRIENLRQEAAELESKVALLSEEDHRQAIEEKYAELFGKCFSVASSTAQLFLI